MKAASVVCLVLATLPPGQAESPSTTKKPEAVRVIDDDTIMVSQAGRSV